MAIENVLMAMPRSAEPSVLREVVEDAAGHPLKILVIDQSGTCLAAVRKAAAISADDLEVTGDTGYGPVALTCAREFKPDLVVVSAEEPLMRTVDTIQILTGDADASWVVVAMAGHDDADLFRKLVLAGVRDVLVRGWSASELRASLTTAYAAGTRRRTKTADGRVHRTAGTIVTVFGDKGGVGKSTLAANLALALARETGRSVALVDLDVPHGDVAILLNLPTERGVGAAVAQEVLGDPLALLSLLVTGPEGVHVLSGSLPAGVGSLAITGAMLTELLTRLSELHDYVVVDTPPGINEFSAAALDVSSMALLVTTPELPCLRRTRTCLNLFESMGFPPDKVKVILNRASSKTSIDDVEVRKAIGQPIWRRVSNDHAVLTAAASGRPAVLADRQTPFARDVLALARIVGNIEMAQPGRWTRLLKAIGR